MACCCFQVVQHFQELGEDLVCLPLIHAWTWLSCDGHGQGKAPFICARNVQNFRWLRGVMRHITPRHLQVEWQFEEAVEKGVTVRATTSSIL